jgi:hypothetical protein
MSPLSADIIAAVHPFVIQLFLPLWCGPLTRMFSQKVRPLYRTAMATPVDPLGSSFALWLQSRTAPQQHTKAC